MKLVLIAYNEALNMEVLNVLEKNDLSCYTKWEKVYGSGENSEPHLGTHIWPKANDVMAVVMEDEKVPSFMKSIRELRERYPKQGIKAFVLPVEEVS